MNLLWLARSLPYPLTAGDRIYSAKLAAATAEAGAHVVFAGLSADTSPEPAPGITWHAVPGKQRSQLHALVSTRPLVTARHATRSYRKHALDLLRSRSWDAVVIDHYGSGWIQPLVAAAPNRPVRVFIAHNHETSVTGSQWRESAGFGVGRAYLWQNWLKTTSLEKRVARASDLITAITDADAKQFARDAPGVRTIQLTPGYDGKRVEHRAITAETPRSIVLFGSYLWSAKRASLTLFLDQADAAMVRAGITIDVVGDMDPALRRSLSGKYRSARFHGFVQDAAPFLASARIAVLAEPVGGGFKLKLLEYIFNRVPIAALAGCASGLPDHVRKYMLLADDIPTLLGKVIERIDQVDRLNDMHDGAYKAADRQFDWGERGRSLLNAIGAIRSTSSRGQPLVAGRHEAAELSI